MIESSIIALKDLFMNTILEDSHKLVAFGKNALIENKMESSIKEADLLKAYY